MSQTTLTIAIIGGGIAGATLANALLAHPHLSIHIFESAPEFSERGAAVGIAMNGQKALAEIGGAVADVISRAGGVTMSSSRLVMVAGPNSMELIFDLAPEQRGKVVHRAALLAELLKQISEETKHTNKRVVKIDASGSSGVVINFDDGTTFEADAVIGADGLRGFVRGHILGKEHPAVQAKHAGFWDARSLISMQKAKELLGEEYFEVDRQYGWIGDGGFFMHDILDNGETVQCVICGVMDESWSEDEWSRKLDRADLEKAVETWDEKLKKGFVEVMLQNPDLKAFAEQHHDIDAPTYAKGRVCIMGDAAHASTPWQGSGAGQAIEDAMVLQALLKEISDSSRISAAFQVYDEVRRGRTQHIVHSSAGTGLILTGRGSETGLDIEKIREALPPRWVPIHTLDLAEHKKDAVARLKAI